MWYKRYDVESIFILGNFLDIVREKALLDIHQDMVQRRQLEAQRSRKIVIASLFEVNKNSMGYGNSDH